MFHLTHPPPLSLPRLPFHDRRPCSVLFVSCLFPAKSVARRSQTDRQSISGSRELDRIHARASQSQVGSTAISKQEEGGGEKRKSGKGKKRKKREKEKEKICQKEGDEALVAGTSTLDLSTYYTYIDSDAVHLNFTNHCSRSRYKQHSRQIP